MKVSKKENREECNEIMRMYNEIGRERVKELKS